MAYHIYKITNQVNGKVYVGCTTGSVHVRWRGHLSALRHLNKFTTTFLYEAMVEHGVDNFLVEPLEECEEDKEVMRERERFWIWTLSSMHPNGYNMVGKLPLEAQKEAQNT